MTMTATRRPILRAILAGAGGAFTLGAAPSDPDVVIVGAGSAGLAAAQALIKAKRRVVVLEATGRIGGRAFTESKTFGAPFDHGCAWLHAADRNPYSKIGRDLGFDLVDHDYALDALFLGQRRASAQELTAINAAEEEMVEQIAEAAKTRDVAASDVVRITSPAHEAAADYLGKMDFAVDLDELSTADYAAGDDLDPNLLCRQGFGAIVAKHFADIPVRVNAPVRRINYGGKGVEIVSDVGTIRAKAVIVTVSTGVLASDTIAWDPVLPVAKQEAFHDLPMGMLAKIPLQILDGERFGLAPFTDLMQERHGKQDIYFLSFPFNYDLMVGFVGGDWGWEMSAMGSDAAVDFATARLVDMFGASARKSVGKGLITGWAQNPWTRGAYTAAAPGKFAARAELARPLNEQVFFAGEALGGALVQTCAGAYLSGQRAAAALLKTIRA
jgi:monoamine oxidase